LQELADEVATFQAERIVKYVINPDQNLKTISKEGEESPTAKGKGKEKVVQDGPAAVMQPPNPREEVDAFYAADIQLSQGLSDKTTHRSPLFTKYASQRARENQKKKRATARATAQEIYDDTTPIEVADELESEHDLEMQQALLLSLASSEEDDLIQRAMLLSLAVSQREAGEYNDDDRGVGSSKDGQVPDDRGVRSSRAAETPRRNG